MTVLQDNIKKLWSLLDEAMIRINQPIANRHEKFRSGKIDHDKLDKEKDRGEALGIARSISELSGWTLDAVREEAVDRYVHRHRVG